MKTSKLLLTLFLLVSGSIIAQNTTKPIKLPQPNYEGNVSVEEALLKRRSIRSYGNQPLSIEEISQLAWAAQGITKKVDNLPSWWKVGDWQGGYRTAPSAGALYPIELYLVIGKLNGLSAGIYKYLPKNHELIKINDDDKRADIFDSSSNQKWIKRAPVIIVIAAVYERTEVKYGKRAERYVNIEAGNVSQNIFLQAETLNLGTVFVGAFRDDILKNKVGMKENEYPLGIMPVGKKRLKK